MSIPELVKADAQVNVTARAQIRHRCPYKDEIDDGDIAITWICNGYTIELHSLAAYLVTFADQVISHEDLIEFIFVDLGTLGRRITITSVTARFTTAGLTVEVSRAVPDHAVGT